MEKIAWYKSAHGSDVFKSDDFKKNLKKNEDATLIECLYLDTAQMALLQNDTAFMIVCRAGELEQMVAFERPDEGMDAEYTTIFPENGVNLSLFPPDVCQKLCDILQNVPLQIFSVSAFEEKTRLLTMEGYRSHLLIRIFGLFENETDKDELCTLQLESLEEGEGESLAEKLINEGVLTPCVSPWIEAMRFRSSGLKPLLAEKKIKKIISSKLSVLIMVRLFGLIRAYTAIDAGAFEKAPIHRLRVEARKMLSLIEVFEGVFTEKAPVYQAFLLKLIDDTDELCAIDLLSEEVDTIVAVYNHFNFDPLKQKLASKRVLICSQLKSAYEQGEYADPLAAFWVDMHKKMLEGFGDEEMHIVKAFEHIKEWVIQLNVCKKSELYETERMHTYRKTVRKLRYALEGFMGLTTKRIGKAIKSCKKLQDEFGMAGDISQHIKTLERLAAEESHAELSLLCGVCCGVFSESHLDIQKEALNVWKDCRNDLKALEDTL